MFKSNITVPLFSPYRMKARLSREHYKEVAATGRAPIYLRITHGSGPGPGKSLDISTGVYLTAKEWDQKGQKVRGQSAQNQVDYATLKAWVAKADEVYLQLKNQPKLTVHDLKRAIVGDKQSPRLTLLALADIFYENKSRPELRKAFNTLAGYRTRRTKLEQHLREAKSLELLADYVDLPWLRKFERWCVDKKQYSPTTAKKHISHIQEVIAFGAHEGLLPVNLVVKYKCEVLRTPSDPAYLPEADVQQLATARLSTRGLQDVADTWLFCCYTGMSFVDYHRFTVAEHLHTDADGEQWIRIERQKNMWRTKAKVSIPVFRETRTLLDAYRGHLPKMSLAFFNKQLKSVSHELCLAIPLTAGLARHTCSHRLRNIYQFTDDEAAAVCGHTKAIMNNNYSRKREEGLKQAMRRQGLARPLTLLEQLRQALADPATSEEFRNELLKTPPPDETSTPQTPTS